MRELLKGKPTAAKLFQARDAERAAWDKEHRVLEENKDAILAGDQNAMKKHRDALDQWVKEATALGTIVRRSGLE